MAPDFAMANKPPQIMAAYLALIIGIGLPMNLRVALAKANQTTSPNRVVWKFDFGPGKVAPGYTQVLQQTTYSKEAGYGFEPGSNISCVDRGGKNALQSDLCTSDQPFFFSVALPEGNYNVTITFGDQDAETNTTVKAELRRLMLEEVYTAARKFATRSFTV